MTIGYEPVSMDKQDAYLKKLAQSPQKVSDYSFANIWGWAEEYGLEWSWGKQCVWLRQTKPEILHWAPVGPWDSVDWGCCSYMADGTEFIRVPEGLALIWKTALPEHITLEEARGHWDYVYSVPDLIALKGNKFHKKKNHLNQFKKKYTYVYQAMEAECVEEALQLQAQWCEWRECKDSPALVAENRAIERVMMNWDRLPSLMGGAVYIDGEMVAYTVAEPLTETTVVVHFEKGKPGYRGMYQAINHMFLENDAADYQWVNREQDLDDEGLRKAKESYHPEFYEVKHRVRVGPVAS